MEINLEIFYGEDENAKVTHLDQIFRVFQTQVAKKESLKTSRLHFKAFARVLSDDFKKSPDLSFCALRNMHIIIKNAEEQVRQEIIEENPLDVFLITCCKIFAWEMRRLSKIYSLYYESILQNENSPCGSNELIKSRSNESEAEKTMRKNNQFEQTLGKRNVLGLIPDNCNNILKDQPNQTLINTKPTFSKDSREAKVLRTINMNLVKQTRTFTLIVLIIREYFSFFNDFDAKQVNDFQNYFKTLGMTEHFVRCLDYEDPTLLRAVILLLTEIANEEIVLSLIEKGLLTRITRFVNNKDCQFAINLVFEVLKYQKAREKLTLSFLKEIVAGLEKGNIANSLAILNLLSVEKEIQSILLELEVPNHLINVALACFRKDDKKDGKKLLWNVLINLATHKGAVDKFLSHPLFSAFFDHVVNKGTESCFKFLENVLWFSDDFEAKKKFGKYAQFFLEFLEKTEETDNIRIAASISILGEIYQEKERKPITLMMKIVKKPYIHFQTYISVFGFLNKALYSMPNCCDLVNTHVAEYSLKHFFTQEKKIEAESSFQFLFFVYNLMVIRKFRVDVNEFCNYVDSFEFVNVRLIALVMNCFDAFLSLALWNKENTTSIFKKKTDFFRKLLQRINQNADIVRYQESQALHYR